MADKQKTSSRRFDLLEDTLKQTQVNTSIYMEKLTDEHTTTNRQLEIMADKQNIAGQQVYFSVFRLEPNLTPDYSPLFAGTLTNTGQYNKSSGIFTCPLAGLYYFSFSFEHNSGDSGVARCYFKQKYGFPFVYVAVRYSPYEMASGSVIRHLSVNDTMRLECNVGWQYVNTNMYNAVFNGFLITPD